LKGNWEWEKFGETMKGSSINYVKNSNLDFSHLNFIDRIILPLPSPSPHFHSNRHHFWTPTKKFHNKEVHHKEPEKVLMMVRT
jgi:hypothetical protein